MSQHRFFFCVAAEHPRVLLTLCMDTDDNGGVGGFLGKIMQFLDGEDSEPDEEYHALPAHTHGGDNDDRSGADDGSVSHDDSAVSMSGHHQITGPYIDDESNDSENDVDSETEQERLVLLAKAEKEPVDIFVCGSPGAGKSSFMRALAQRLGASMFFAPDHVHIRTPQSASKSRVGTSVTSDGRATPMSAMANGSEVRDEQQQQNLIHLMYYNPRRYTMHYIIRDLSMHVAGVGAVRDPSRRFTLIESCPDEKFLVDIPNAEETGALSSLEKNILAHSFYKVIRMCISNSNVYARYTMFIYLKASPAQLRCRLVHKRRRGDDVSGDSPRESLSSSSSAKVLPSKRFSSLTATKDKELFSGATKDKERTGSRDEIEHSADDTELESDDESGVVVPNLTTLERDVRRRDAMFLTDAGAKTPWRKNKDIVCLDTLNDYPLESAEWSEIVDGAVLSIRDLCQRRYKQCETRINESFGYVPKNDDAPREEVSYDASTDDENSEDYVSMLTNRFFAKNRDRSGLGNVGLHDLESGGTNYTDAEGNDGNYDASNGDDVLLLQIKNL